MLARESAYQEVVLNAITRRGKSITCHVTCTPLISTDKEIHGVILLMEEKER
ncbi:MAG: hypothetical protein HYZ72_14600 [Deltaproteobacteria bacterium]|nr:hypothetical protein [Deltaproteobacteria bacterium]